MVGPLGHRSQKCNDVSDLKKLIITGAHKECNMDNVRTTAMAIAQ